MEYPCVLSPFEANTSFQRHSWGKFDLDDENEIRFDDFSATMSTFVMSNDESLQTLFEIFDSE